MEPMNIVALCGWPKSGKTSMAEYLRDTQGYKIIDDGLILRNFVHVAFQVPMDSLYTPEGKARTIEILGKTWEIRKILGQVGNKLEELFGENIMADIAMRQARMMHAFTGYNKFVFPSVRKTQGQLYKQEGGLIVKMDRPGYGDSGNDFDRFDQEIVDMTIMNTGVKDALTHFAEPIAKNAAVMAKAMQNVRDTQRIAKEGSRFEGLH